jgi:hypothetical protein
MNEQRTFTIGGKEVTFSKRSIKEAVGKIQPGPIKKYSVLVGGVRYPIKQVVSMASGQPTATFIATDAYRILSHLGFKVEGDRIPQAVKTKLTLEVVARSGEGRVYGNGQVIQYRVVGLPRGDQAMIANFGAPERNEWKVLRVEDDAQGEWTGEYKSAEAALAEIQKEYAN